MTNGPGDKVATDPVSCFTDRKVLLSWNFSVSSRFALSMFSFHLLKFNGARKGALGDYESCNMASWATEHDFVFKVRSVFNFISKEINSALYQEVGSASILILFETELGCNDDDLQLK